MAKVIVVGDDSEQVRGLLELVLKQAGYRVFLAKDWNEVRETMRHADGPDKPAAYVLDNLGPISTTAGFELAHQLHRLGHNVIWTSAVMNGPPGVMHLPKGSKYFIKNLLRTLSEMFGE